MILMIEAQARYIVSALRTMEERGIKSIEVKRGVQSQFNEELQLRLKGTVWATGCTSWYKTRSGKITTQWPGFTFEFDRRTRRFNVDDYLVIPRNPSIS
jgi:hypothetical protein